MYRVSHFVSQFAVFLLAGISVALLWANIAPQSYSDFVEFRLMEGLFIGYPNPDAAFPGARTLTIRYLSGGVLMAFFFLIAGKEIWEAVVLRNGSLRGKKAVAPITATLGGMIGGAVAYLAISGLSGQEIVPASGWVVPMASDIAICYIFGRLIFGAGHPALRFLLLLTLCDDVAGLLIAGAGIPGGVANPAWLLLSLAAAVLAFVLFNRLPRVLTRNRDLRGPSNFMGRMTALPFLVAGALSWYGVQEAGLHPALGLLPIVPAIPHADRAFGLFAEAEELLHDLLNRIAHLLIYPIYAALFLFGLTHGGAEIAAAAPASWAVLAALWIGKPLGILLGGLAGAHILGAGLPIGMTRKDLGLAALLASVGLTVPLLSLGPALPGGEIQEAARLGVMLSLLAAPMALILARSLSVKRRDAPGPRGPE